jgi:RNA polymerase sigma-70 factor (ECF subfamily)
MNTQQNRTESDPLATERFVTQLTEHQIRLHGYVFSLLGDHSRAADVVQETNLVLWRKIGEFNPDKPFLPWALAIARFQVMAHLRDKKRDRLLLDEKLAQTLSAEAETQAAQFDSIRDALRLCLQKLTPTNRAIVQHRYFHALPVAEVASAIDRSTAATKVALLRIRRQLAECVEQRIATVEAEG